MFQTVRFKLLVMLLSFVFITILALILSFNYTTASKEELSQLKQNMNRTNVLLFEDVNVIHDFFAYETINSSFFETGKSKFLEKHYNLCKKIELSLDEIDSDQKSFGYELSENVNQIKEKFKIYKGLTNNIIKEIMIMGFKDYGIEGRMRNYAHLLEGYNKEVGLINVLGLRRHEKDFIIRQDDQYIKKFDELFVQIKSDLNRNKLIQSEKKKRIVYILNNYSYEFKRLTQYEKLIGLKNQKGLKGEIDKVTALLDIKFAGMIELATTKEKNKLMQINLLFIGMGFVLILICIVAALFISSKASKSIIELKNSISQFIKSDFTKRNIFSMKETQYEVDVLANSFNIMEQQIVNQIGKLKETNEELEILLYRSSHDIKGPLTSIKGISNLANGIVKDPQALLYFSMIDSSLDKLNKIVDELGVVKNIKSDEIEKENIKFDELIHSVFKEFRFLPNFENTIFSAEINLDGEFVSDPKLIRTIFQKLIENSIMYSKTGKGMSFIRVSINKQRNEMVRIVVADNGIGIKKEFLSKIFDMFFVGTHLSHGAGLGLYIVQNSLRKLNGAISVESEEKVGTSFTILLPNVNIKKSVEENIQQNIEIAKFDTKNLVLNYI